MVSELLDSPLHIVGPKDLHKKPHIYTSYHYKSYKYALWRLGPSKLERSCWKDFIIRPGQVEERDGRRVGRRSS